MPRRNEYDLICIGSGPAGLNYPTLVECYKVAAYNAANKLALIRQATGAVVPAIAEQATGAVVPALAE